MRQDQKRYAKNLRVKREMRGAIKEFKAKPSFDALRKAQSSIDTAVKKNLIKKNNGARHMAQLSKIAKEAGVKIPSTKKAAPKTSAKATSKTTTKTPAKKTSKTTTAKK